MFFIITGIASPPNCHLVYTVRGSTQQGSSHFGAQTVIERAIEKLKLKSIIISIDSNSHSEVWFDRNNDERGEKVLDFVCNKNLVVLNNNENTPTFDNGRGQSSIDLTITSSNLLNIVILKICSQVVLIVEGNELLMTECVNIPSLQG